MRRALRLSALAAVVALLAAAPAVAQAPADVRAAFRPRPLPAELTRNAPALLSIELPMRSGRPVWLLPLAGLVAGAVVYPMLVDGGCDDTDCMLYISEPVTGAIIGLLGGIAVQVVLMAVGDAKNSDPAMAVRPR